MLNCTLHLLLKHFHTWYQTPHHWRDFYTRIQVLLTQQQKGYPPVLKAERQEQRVQRYLHLRHTLDGLFVTFLQLSVNPEAELVTLSPLTFSNRESFQFVKRLEWMSASYHAMKNNPITAAMFQGFSARCPPTKWGFQPLRDGQFVFEMQALFHAWEVERLSAESLFFV